MPRPIPTFRGFVGQSKPVAMVRGQLAGAKARGEAAPSTLLIGPSGVGKTLLARAMADEYGTSMISVHGAESPARLAEFFKGARPFDFCFVDEAHNLTFPAQEILLPVIDFGRLPPAMSEPVRLSDDSDRQSNEPIFCTLVLATDQPGKLLNALRKRMELTITLSLYSLPEMKAIVDRLATDLRLLISPQAAKRIAQASAGLPRRARHHLQKLRRRFFDAKNRQLTSDDVRQFLCECDTDAKGHGPDERRYLSFLAATRKASLQTLASHLGHDAEYVKQQIEHPLIHAGFVVIGRNGRELTRRGREWLDRPRKANEKVT